MIAAELQISVDDTWIKSIPEADGDKQMDTYDKTSQQAIVVGRVFAVSLESRNHPLWAKRLIRPACTTRHWLGELGWEVLSHPPFSPELAPNISLHRCRFRKKTRFKRGLWKCVGPVFVHLRGENIIIYHGIINSSLKWHNFNNI